MRGRGGQVAARRQRPAGVQPLLPCLRDLDIDTRGDTSFSKSRTHCGRGSVQDSCVGVIVLGVHPSRGNGRCAIAVVRRAL